MIEEQFRARLFAVSGLRQEAEQEVRATSALLSVLQVVRPLSKRLLGPLGASLSDSAEVLAWTEVPFETADGEGLRPDGIVTVSSRGRSFTALIEVKTGASRLDADQLANYLRLAQREGFDCVLTISTEVAAFDGAHPTKGAVVPKGVALHHLSWARILSESIRELGSEGVTDEEQAWLLGELIRYLQHGRSGVAQSRDMGKGWTTVWQGTRDGLLSRPTAEVHDICKRWDQLLHSCALDLAAALRSDVSEPIPRAHRSDPALREKEMAEQLCDEGKLTGQLRIPGAISDLSVTADLRSGRIMLQADFGAPTDKGAKGRVSWLLRELREAPGELVIEAFAERSSNPERATLDQLRKDPARAFTSTQRPPARFRVTQLSEMGRSRSATAKNSFAVSVAQAVDGFYRTTVQHIRHVPPPAPKTLKEPAPAPAEPVRNDSDEPGTLSGDPGLPEGLGAPSPTNRGRQSVPRPSVEGESPDAN